jgi:hypothetical protein
MAIMAALDLEAGLGEDKSAYGRRMTPLERAEERYRLATVEIGAARAVEDAYLGFGERPMSQSF